MRLSTLESKNYLYEGLNKSEFKSVKLWESAGYAIKEAQLTADQINQLFQNIEQSSTDSGSNRTMLGKGKDVAVEVNKAWKDLKTKLENSKPMTNFDQAMSDQLSKIGMGAKDPQFHGQVSDWVQKYRDFAKQHPIAQGAIYATLVALSGLLTAGVGSIAAIGLLKLADKVLQGERFSAALGSAATTAAAAYGASELGKLAHGADQVPSGVDPTLPKLSPDQMSELAKIYNAAGGNVVKQGTQVFYQMADGQVGSLSALSLGMQPEELIKVMADAAAKSASESIQYSKNLSILEVRAVIGSVVLAEGGVWDAVKSGAAGVAGAVADKAKTVGHNLTTKVTADKLQSAWKQAGSPTDSEEIKQVLTGAGADAGIIDKVYAELQIPTTPAVDGSTDDLFAQIRQLSPKQQQQILKMLQA